MKMERENNMSTYLVNIDYYKRLLFNLDVRQGVCLLENKHNMAE